MLSDAFVDAARQERRRLFAELNQTPVFQQWWALRKLLHAYTRQRDEDDEMMESVQTPTPQPSPLPTQTAQPQPRNRPTSKASQVVTVAADWFRTHGKRAQSLEVLNVLKTKGFEFSGTKPTAILASILSHSELFDNVRGEGYGLRSWSDAQPANNLDSRQEDRANTNVEATNPTGDRRDQGEAAAGDDGGDLIPVAATEPHTG